MSVALGIDTGGTYTDAVLVEYESNTILASAKALTTKHDLSIGIRQAIERVLAERSADVQLVSLSTTLATNAIVEGNGAPTCTLLVGYRGRAGDSPDLFRELGAARHAHIPGGHLTTGEEWEPLDLDAARMAIQEHAPVVDAFAVSAYFATRNPAHELAVKHLVTALTGLPVTCGHELTHRLNAPRRAITATLNARLVPLICELIDALEHTLGEVGIHAPLMVVKGDGSLIDSAVARQRPIETILSGPAASVVGARHLVGDGDAIVVDMGGTTTDIAVITRGQPALSDQGAQVGPWRTMVEAIDVHTAGIGGDSRVWLNADKELGVGPRRVVPVSLLAEQSPSVVDVLKRQVRSCPRKATDGEFLILQRPDSSLTDDRTSFEADLMAALREGPCALDEAYRIMRYPPLYMARLDQLERRGIIVRSALTPTDAAHVTGEYTEWNREAALLAAQLLAERVGQDTQAFCRRVLSLTSESIAAEVVAKLLHDDGLNGHHAGAVDSHLIARALCPTPGANLACDLSVRPSIVAIGAPVRTYFPRVSELLHGVLHIPEHAEVANALGAIAGSVVCRVHILVVPNEDESGFRIHFPGQLLWHQYLGEAQEEAKSRGRQLAMESAQRAGAQGIQVRVDQRDHSAPITAEGGEEIYLGTTLEITAVGRPRLALRAK